ncbi:hypothetical protein WMQ48_04595 [Vibrio cidicii]|uniref:hypothetical protein n=1 Tax=Vibrio cidicii TaxID=1763883 RepID=UPI0028B2F987|nr:hypothetical protein [Vibrio navarrensis]EJL6568562.1 hypothetical protein [Vibrio navarrensis]HDY8043858.1 hypothetical protein [Vibrio vulnificus]
MNFAISKNQKSLSSQPTSADTSALVSLNFNALKHHSRTVHFQDPIDLFVVFAQAHRFVCLSHEYSEDRSLLFGRLSDRFLHQVESFDDILDVVFTMNKSNFIKTHFEDNQLKIYLNDDLSDSESIISHCFSLQEWLCRLSQRSSL